MLKTIDPLLNGALLGHLADMGHGDVLAIVDRNFPAASTARRLVTLSGVDVTTAARAILTVFPVDTFVEPALLRMGPVGAEDTVLEVHAEVQAAADEAEGRAVVSAPVGDEGTVLEVHADLQAAVDEAEGRAVASAPLERFEFYRRAAGAYLVVATTEARPYGCFLLVKGVV